jgi:predicted PolB exonuclease-like 3'-5' exonuclease
VSWNGGGFDLPVLHYRALLHGISAPRYWETGEQDTSFRYDNYLSRYHQRHLDLMDLLALYNSRAVAPLDQVATLLGFPGKMGMSGAKVFDAVQEGKLAAVRDYCETDVLNTYLVYLRFQLLRGRLDKPGYDQETRQLREYLAQQQDRPHLQQFLKAWQ